MSDVITPRQMVDMMLQASHELQDAQDALIVAVKKEAETARVWRRARANAYLATSGTVGEREASVAKSTADEEYEAKLAEGLSKAMLEAVRNRRTQLSALQTVAGSVRAELEYFGTAPAEVVR